MPMKLDASGHFALPEDFEQAVLVGRVWRPDRDGPSVVAARGVELVDISQSTPTMRDLCEAPEPAGLAFDAAGEPIGLIDEILANTPRATRDAGKPWLLAPTDLQAIKAAGVTFAVSMLERVIEEKTRGAPEQAAAVRAEIGSLIGDDLARLKPGSPQAMALKQLLIDKGMWSQYLEVGIGPDAEVFTKAPPMAAVGHLAEIGIHPMSSWNNPEPEVVLVAASSGAIVGATLGNDVNLRDVEGRSALLLGKAKDNNASASLGPFIRLFARGFSLDDVSGAEVTLYRRRRRRLPPRRGERHEPDQPRPRRSDGRHAQQASPVPRRRRPLSRHHVRAGRGSRRQGPGLHPQGRRHRHHRLAQARPPVEPGGAHRRGRAVDLRHGGVDAQPRQARTDLGFRQEAATPHRYGGSR